MQSELPPESHHNLLVNSSPGHPINTRQHGNDCSDDRWVSEPRHSGSQDPAGFPAASTEDNGSMLAFMNGPGKGEVTYSSLDTTPAKSSSRYMSLQTLPNEVLTHILSHLPPPSLSSIALVSRRFHTLVTTPHAWRIAFSRYFPGPFAENGGPADQFDHLSDRRSFSRLTTLASWRSEYILRTRLLRSLSRGKPEQLDPPKKGAVRSANVRHGSAVATYTSQLVFPVSHIHGSFKNQPSFLHGAAEQGIASASDASAVKVGSWGLADFQRFRHFADLYPGDAEYGEGSGDMVGLPNSMDVSQLYGMIYGEGCPQGRAYFISTTEQRGRFLGLSESTSQPKLGIPALNVINTAICSVWIAKSSQILKMTGGLVGMLSGSSTGVLTAYALGPHPTYEKRFERGQVTARWVLCPGVPIIAIAVDDNYSPSRHERQRIWAAVLNALGEVFYLTQVPQPEEPINSDDIDRAAWKTGRSVQWELVETSRRTARPDPFSREPVDGSYSPRSSSDSMKLDENQIAAETKEIEKFMALKPKHWRKVCESWDMRRKLHVDFAGDDDKGAGESLIVIRQGFGENKKASIRRFTRKVTHQPESDVPVFDHPPSLFGGPTPSPGANKLRSTLTEWFLTDFSVGDRKYVQITTTALDLSTYASLALDEDPLITMSGASSASSSPLPGMKPSNEIPGQRARYMAVGTSTGSVFIWDIRSPTARNNEVINSVAPLRVIHTESPQVTCVALTSLYLVHGGSDGLVQAWDPLASSTRPIRTINSRFSSRARRRLVQAEALGPVGNNFFAAGALCLDPDPTMLRGMVGLGTHLRYWAYSSSSADQYRSNKRRLRRGKRGSISSAEGQRFNSSGRGALQDEIAEEMVEMERQKIADEKRKIHLSSRFGVDLLGPDASEEEMLAYAQLLSEESYVESSVTSTSVSLGPNDSSFNVSSSSSPCQHGVDDDLAPDIAEAIRLSLLDESPGASSSILRSSTAKDSSNDYLEPAAESSRQQEMDDLEFAIQLSRAEYDEGRDIDEFPALAPAPQSPGKNKGKGRAL
ncbi:F-box and WD [Aspergillus sclerotialis]|uniref:F-box and WD n=1 Tax=Aspergillus sclerotialis TaxID=2070753 RepID=A0A3A2ZGN4_9EURO|nr:F-box and WD [Aspergillus sclerotialis]